jgi:hypothetical protein
MSRTTSECAECGEVREIAAQGLCFRCYRRDERNRKALWARPESHAIDLARNQRKTRKALMKIMDALDEIESGHLVSDTTVEAWRNLLRPEVENIALSLTKVAVNSELEKPSEVFTLLEELGQSPIPTDANTEQENSSELFTQELPADTPLETQEVNGKETNPEAAPADAANLMSALRRSDTSSEGGVIVEEVSEFRLPPAIPQLVTKGKAAREGSVPPSTRDSEGADDAA